MRFAQNVTDVDDPLLERAEATGVAWQDLAADQVELFRRDMAALRVLPPQDYVGVTESLDDVTRLVQSMRPSGAVYQVDDPDHRDWYFAVTEHRASWRTWGSIGPRPFELFAERGGDPERPGKRHPLDCLVWRLERTGEPAWDSPLGRGRPGWHIECTAIALAALGKTFDVQAGGSDLAFPHHPMSAAEALVATGQPFARVYLHTGMVGLDGEKMSKSRGNLVFVSRLLGDGVDPMVVRLVLLAHHYRDDWQYTPQALAEARARLAVWSQAMAAPAGPPAGPVIEGVRRALRDDLDAPTALAVVDSWAAGAASGTDRSAPAEVSVAVDALLGVAVGGSGATATLPR